MRLSAKILLINVLAACGAPGSDAVFTKGNPKIPSADSAATIDPASASRLVAEPHGGYFRRVGDDLQFQPCGTRVPLEIIGSRQARSSLKERFRWNAVWEGRKMFGVFQGSIVTDTPGTGGVRGDTVTASPRTRFFIVAVDSVRTWRDGDCSGMRIN